MDENFFMVSGTNAEGEGEASGWFDVSDADSLAYLIAMCSSWDTIEKSLIRDTA